MVHNRGNNTVIAHQGQTRNGLAIGITTISILGIIAISTAIILVSDDAVTNRAQTVLNAVLPLLGTWVGTVLAFFFSRENFESASRSVERMAQQLSMEEHLELTVTASAMTPRSQMMVVQDPQTTSLVALLDELERKDIKRLPILDANEHVQGVVFRDDIINFLYRTHPAQTDEERQALTLEDLLQHPSRINHPYTLVSDQDSLSQTQARMRAIENCRVVFVTKSGRKNDRIVGMLTNTDFADMIQAYR